MQLRTLCRRCLKLSHCIKLKMTVMRTSGDTELSCMLLGFGFVSELSELFSLPSPLRNRVTAFERIVTLRLNRPMN